MDNSAWVIQKPATARYTADVLRLEHRELPEPAIGQVLVRTIYLSLDPSNLMWLKLQTGWMEDVKVGDIMKGPSVAVVEQSRDPRFSVGDYVVGALDWRLRSVVDAGSLQKLTVDSTIPLAAHLTLFSHVGKAALIGLTEICKIQPGEEVLVTGAYGATGGLACEIAKANGCRVVGIAGGERKCNWLRDELKLDGVIDYKRDDVSAAIAHHMPRGVDAYFDNVGGELLDIVLLHLKVHARVAICGAISQYADPTDAVTYRHGNLFQLLMKRARMEGFVVPDFMDRYEELDATLKALYLKGAVSHRPHIIAGLENTAESLEMLLTGANDGKLMVQVSPEAL